VTRRLTRSPDDKVLFGVCGGLATRFGVDAVWIRLGFVALALLFGKGVLLYLILALVLPKSPALVGSPSPAYLPR
jgi:phage shock protein PspC (stress-responsive transcriptional regulator)